MGEDKQLLVKDVMTRTIITISESATIQELSAVLLEKRINGVPVTSASGELCGIVTVTDLYKVLKGKYFEKNFGKFFTSDTIKTVGQIMSKDVFTVDPECTMDQLISIAVYKSIHTIPVVENGKIIGVIGMRDILSIGLKT